MDIQEYIEKISAVIAEYYDNAIITIQTINDIYTKYIGDPKEILYGKFRRLKSN